MSGIFSEMQNVTSIQGEKNTGKRARKRKIMFMSDVKGTQFSPKPHIDMLLCCALALLCHDCGDGQTRGANIYIV